MKKQIPSPISQNPENQTEIINSAIELFNFKINTSFQKPLLGKFLPFRKTSSKV